SRSSGRPCQTWLCARRGCLLRMWRGCSFRASLAWSPHASSTCTGAWPSCPGTALRPRRRLPRKRRLLRRRRATRCSTTLSRRRSEGWTTRSRTT
ncbi:unnamed protein product, partial [Ectocarpus sp. 12 AP-2014]